jgi:branched-chain amino acid transport system ATP-binding protein
MDVDVEVLEGSICALVGTNGAGKSTVLRAATGLVRLSHGSVRLFGQDVTRLSPEDRVGRGLVLVAGGRATFPSLSVEESVRIGTYTFRHDRSRVEEAVATALAPFPRLVERRTQRAGSLSGGEQQLLALARALAMAPRVLLVDELTIGLAPAAADEVLAAVTALAGTGVTVLLVEQSIRRALAVAETAYFLERGQVRFDGPAAALATRTDLLRPVLLAP